MSNSSTPYEVYCESKQRLEKGRGDSRDDVLVGLWGKTKDFIKQRDSYKAQAEEAERRARSYKYELSLAESRLHLLTGGKISLEYEELVEPTEH